VGEAWLGEHGVSCVMALRRSDRLAMPAGEQRADALAAAVPFQAGPRTRLRARAQATYGNRHQRPGTRQRNYAAS
jgi:hypothetical protein